MRLLSPLPLLLILIALSNARPASGRILMENYKIGFDGQHHAGCWTPVSVTLENRREADESESAFRDFEGTLAVEIDSGDQKFVFSAPVTLPRNSRKRFTLYGRFPYRVGQFGAVPPKMILRNEHRLEINSQSLDDPPLDPTIPLIVVATTQRANFRPPGRFGRRAQIISYLDPENLPDRWFGYQGVAALVLPGLERNRLSAEQEQAILHWIESGGRLVVLGGKDAATYSESFIEKKLGVKFLPPRRLELPIYPTEDGTGGMISADVAPIDSRHARPLLHSGPLLLAGRVERGLGYADAWAFDLEDRNLNAAPLIRMLWETPLGDAREPFADNLFGEYLRKYGNPFKADEGRVTPSIPMIILILALYFVTVGPLNFLYLARQKKLEWSWFSLPVIVLSFSVGIYYIGVLTKGGKRTLRHFNVIECRLNQPVAMLNSVVSLWSPSREKYAFDPLQETGVILDQQDWFPAYDGPYRFHVNPFEQLDYTGSTDLFRVKGDTHSRLTPAGMRIASKPMLQWNISLMHDQDLVPLREGIQGNVQWSETLLPEQLPLRGKLLNQTPYDFEETLLLLHLNNAQGEAEIFTAKPGAWKQGAELALDAQALFRFADHALSLNASGIGSDALFQRNLFATLIKQRFEQLDRNRNAGQVFNRFNHFTGYLIGWTAQQLKACRVTPAPAIDESYSAFVIDLSPTLNLNRRAAGRPYTLGFQSLRPRMTDFQADGRVTPPGWERPFISLQNAAFYLSQHLPPHTAPVRPGRLIIRVGFSPDGNQQQDFSAEIYNYRLDQWTALNDLNSRPSMRYGNNWQSLESFIDAPESADYVNTFSGELLFRIESKQKPQQNGWGDSKFYDLDVKMEITPVEVEI